MKEVPFHYRALPGLGPEKGVMRRDNSDVVWIDGRYHVWYTKGFVEDAPYADYPVAAGYHGALWHATSPDGLNWREEGCALDKGPAGSLEEGAVFTPNIHVAEGRYWLGYCAIARHESLEQLHALPDGQFLAVADDPFGPWQRVGAGPFLWPVDDADRFDSFRVDGLSFLRRNGENWVYYKGRQQGRTPSETKLGLAIAERMPGPWRRFREPVLKSGHEVMFWPQGEGVGTYITAGPEAGTIQYAPDGVSFRTVGRAKDGPEAPSHYCPDCFADEPVRPGPTWGIAMVKSADPLPYLVRWEAPDLPDAFA